MIKQQLDFSGGLDLLTPDINITDNEYRWLINARCRFGSLEPNRKHIQQTDIPSGLLQGICAVGATLIIFVSGKAYYKNDSDLAWTLILGFQMDSSVTQYYTCNVPASFKDFVRKTDANIEAPITLTNDFKVEGTPAGVVVQDGISQPWIIEFDIVNQAYLARVLGDYNTWGNPLLDSYNLEYVPVGKQMMYMSGILFIVSRDGLSLYHSITGRPLDFMIVVDTDGNKLTNESDGGADKVSFAFDFDFITCIVPTGVPDAFFVGTAHNVRIITLDYTRTIFGEPLYNVATIFNMGAVNQYSIIDTLGDYAVIDFDGVKSVNAVQSVKFRGRNGIFSLNVNNLFRTKKRQIIKQKDVAAVTFDNYALFSVDTRYGNLLLVYDLILNKWVSFDITRAHHIIQFVSVEIPTETKLYCITKNGKLWQLYADETTDVPIARTKAYVRKDQLMLQTGQLEHKGNQLNLLFDNATYAGEVTVMEFIDEQESTAVRETKKLNVQVAGIPYAVRPPVLPNNQQEVMSVTFAPREGLTGRKISYIISWTNDAELLSYELITEEVGEKISQKQKQEVFDSTGN